MDELILGMLAGDGYISKEGRFTMEHSIKQFDYLQWKKQLIEKEFNVELKVYHRVTHNTKSIYLDRKNLFLPIRNRIYQNGKKDISLILKEINDIDLFLAFWFFDDAAINRHGIKLCICDSSVEQINKMIDWFKNKVNVSSYIRFEKHGEKAYPFLVFQKFESMVIWSRIKKYAVQVPSMLKKFRNVKTEYDLNYVHVEYNKPTSPRILKIPKKCEINVSDEQLIKYYNHCNSIKRTAIFYNLTLKIVRDILVRNNSLHPVGFKKIR